MNFIKTKSSLFTFIFGLLTFVSFSQSNETIPTHKVEKGRFYIGWGWNRGWFTKSDFHFKGEQYDFVLSDVVAHDRQSKVTLETYLSPKNITIPQYNFRIGYFINKRYDISLGIDHMKYVVDQNQFVNIAGTIVGSGVYDKEYSNEQIQLKEDFLKLEHTDGLNYANIALRQSHEFYTIKKIKIAVTEGIEGGVLIPKTDATLLNKMRNNEWHLAGFGTALALGINVNLYKYLFFQSELKGGYINMSDIRTTPSRLDHAEQSFFFGQYNFSLGARF